MFARIVVSGASIPWGRYMSTDDAHQVLSTRPNGERDLRAPRRSATPVVCGGRRKKRRKIKAQVATALALQRLGVVPARWEAYYQSWTSARLEDAATVYLLIGSF